VVIREFLKILISFTLSDRLIVVWAGLNVKREEAQTPTQKKSRIIKKANAGIVVRFQNNIIF
jgi:hypothetical protein